MQLKTFSAASSAAVLAQIKAELGPDAVILDSREEDGLIHMTAALERDPVVRQQSSFVAAKEKNPDTAEPPARPSAKAPMASPSSEERPGKKKTAGKNAADGSAADFSGLSLTPAHRLWEEEWGSIKSYLFALMKPGMRLDLLSPRQRLALEYLERQGVENEVLLQLHTGLQAAPSESILNLLSGLLPVHAWGESNWKQRIQIITGPFGVGKTSVAIRMALFLRRARQECRICLINADATRGNGRLLLRHYCELSDFAYKEAATTLELIAALSAAERGNYDRILIDWPGLPKGAHLPQALADAGLLERGGNSAEDAAIHLVLPPQYANVELRAIVERYHSPHAGSLIWTKLDEAQQYGQLANIGALTGRPVSALSYGPGLGNSFAPAKKNSLWHLLFKQELPNSAL